MPTCVHIHTRTHHHHHTTHREVIFQAVVQSRVVNQKEREGTLVMPCSPSVVSSLSAFMELFLFHLPQYKAII